MILIEYQQISERIALARPLAYDDAVTAQFREIPGVRWDKNTKSYISDIAAIEAVLELLQEARLARVQHLSNAVPQVTRYQLSLDSRLLPYQVQGAEWLYWQLCETRAGLLADDMGLGKSPQSLCAVEALLETYDSCIIVAPAIVVPHWRREIEKWTTRDEHLPCRYYLYSYEDFQAALKLPANSAPRKRAGKHPLVPVPTSAAAIIFDEAQYIANSKANRAKAIKLYVAQHPKIYRIALTGTPISTKVRNLHHILDVLYPSTFGTWWAFTKRYCDGQYDEILGRGGEKIQRWVSDGASNLEELQARLKYYMLRRTKSEVALQLPERRRICLDIPLPAKIRKQLAKAQQAISLTQDYAASASALLSGVEEHKIPAAVELANELRESGRRVLLLTTRVASAETIANTLGCAIAYGTTPPDERMSILQASELAVSTIYAVTTGINLTNFDTIIFVGLDWVPSTLLQAEARIHRIGQNSNCLIYYLVGEQSIDEIVRSQVLNRLDIFEKALGSEDSGLRNDLGYGTKDVLKAFAEKLNKQLSTGVST